MSLESTNIIECHPSAKPACSLFYAHIYKSNIREYILEENK